MTEVFALYERTEVCKWLVRHVQVILKVSHEVLSDLCTATNR